MINKLYQYLIKLKGPPVKVNQFCNWQSQGVIQWDGFRRIVHIELFECKWYVFVDGSKTAIPANEIILEENYPNMQTQSLKKKKKKNENI